MTDRWLVDISLGTGVVCIVVILAMCTDLISGLYKASLRGEKKTSFGLQRTTLKTITYLGSVMICYGVDILAHLGKIWYTIGWEWLIGVPVFAILIGVFNCIVELVSVREKATAKADRRALKNIKAIVQGLRESEATELIKALQEIVNNGKEK